MADGVTDPLDRVRVDLGSRAYDVVLARGLDGLGQAVAAATRPGRCWVVTDETVDAAWGAAAVRALEDGGMRPERVVLAAGEVHKHRDAWWTIVDAVLRGGVDRRTPVVALGGGVVGDLAGFAAATVMRGLPFVQVPTTLLAMVDSAVGGKTGFNHPVGKNLVGAFHQPVLVWSALDTLATLDPRARRAGLGEVAKTALIDGDAAWNAVLQGADALRRGALDVTADLVARCVRAKARVVAEDEREGGRRAVLNLGHTVGHAVETAGGHGALHHGEAVASGLVAELRWSVAAGHTAPPELAEGVADAVRRLGLPSEVPDLPRSAMLRALQVDKKGDGAMFNLPVLHSVGDARVLRIPAEQLGELLPR